MKTSKRRAKKVRTNFDEQEITARPNGSSELRGEIHGMDELGIEDMGFDPESFRDNALFLKNF